MPSLGQWFIVAFFLLTVITTVFGGVRWLRESQWAQEGFPIRRKQVAAFFLGFAAIAVWCLFYFAYRIARLLGVAALAFAGAAMLMILRMVAPRTADRVVQIGQSIGDKGEWVAVFLLFAFSAAVIGFLLFAPYGVLCILGLKHCGNW